MHLGAKIRGIASSKGGATGEGSVPVTRGSFLAEGGLPWDDIDPIGERFKVGMGFMGLKMLMPIGIPPCPRGA